MLDVDEIRKELINLRWNMHMSQHGFGKHSGLGFGKIQRIESKTNKRAIPIDDLEKWLTACGVSLLEFLSKYYEDEHQAQARGHPVLKPRRPSSRSRIG